MNIYETIAMTNQYTAAATQAATFPPGYLKQAEEESRIIREARMGQLTGTDKNTTAGQPKTNTPAAQPEKPDVVKTVGQWALKEGINWIKKTMEAATTAKAEEEKKKADAKTKAEADKKTAEEKAEADKKAAEEKEEKAKELAAQRQHELDVAKAGR